MIKKLSQQFTYFRLLKSESSDLELKLVTEATLLKRAKALHAQVYLGRGYITEADLLNGAIGPQNDPYQAHAQYFLVDRIIDGQPVAAGVSRLILVNEDKGLHSFRMYVHHALDESARRLIERTGPDKCAEVSALVKAPGESAIVTLLLYRAMWQYGLKHGHKLWLISCETHLFERIKMLFGPALTKIGDTNLFQGHYFVPAMLRIDQSLDALQRDPAINPVRRLMRRRLISFMLRGLPPEHRPG